MIRLKSAGLRAAVCAAIAASILGCAEKKEKVREERVPVTVATAEQRDIPVQVRAIGSVQPISSVAVRALVAGQLQRVWFHEGDDVRKGQMLFTIDQRPYQATLAQAEANRARDEAQARNAESEATRYAELVKKDYVTREEYEKFKSGAEAARAVVAADGAAVQNARLQLAYCEIRSPLDGRTGSLQVQAGNLVKANDTTPLVTINQITPVYVTFSVPESQLGDVRARGLGNVPVSAAPQQGGAPPQSGKLTFVDNAVDATTGTITLKATFTNEGRALWPGEFVNVTVTLSNRANATVVPLQAVQNGQKGQYVYVVTEGDGVQMRPVTVVQQLETQAVIGHGVNAGDTVVTDGQIRLTPKSKVDVKKSL
ncbi:MAG TPA: efflux RND transporter periplasmic adaptor subunit [Thermoanaerobaculia bacterium]|jgi:multidrug efflux system membrane fusion protein|nr:efflux RND transporter periplasmic adaptor subunit [Thermoanaerobaculia bacterium]